MVAQGLPAEHDQSLLAAALEGVAR